MRGEDNHDPDRHGHGQDRQGQDRPPECQGVSPILVPQPHEERHERGDHAPDDQDFEHQLREHECRVEGVGIGSGTESVGQHLGLEQAHTESDERDRREDQGAPWKRRPEDRPRSIQQAPHRPTGSAGLTRTGVRAFRPRRRAVSTRHLLQAIVPP